LMKTSAPALHDFDRYIFAGEKLMVRESTASGGLRRPSKQ
jgi:hypothetical protein